MAYYISFDNRVKANDNNAIVNHGCKNKDVQE
jgi:hypothetical protein